MANIIDDLYFGNLDLSLLDLKQESDYYQTFRKMLTLFDGLDGAAVPEKIRTLHDTFRDLLEKRLWNTLLGQKRGDLIKRQIHVII